MPNLQPVRHYLPNDPYQHVVDNGPIEDLQLNQGLINEVLDTTVNSLAAAVGSQNSLASRLNQSMNANGTLKTLAVDDTFHNIGFHADGFGLDAVAYVRMTQTERDKLAAVAAGATDVKIEFADTEEVTTVLYAAGTVVFNPSDSIAWRVDNTGVYADVLFPLTARHRHYYDLVPVPLNTMSPDYQNYYTTSVATAYAAGSLRVYVNGVKISKLDTVPGHPPDVKFPRIVGPTTTWTSLNYQEDTPTGLVVPSGKFALSQPITAADRIIVEFDVILA